ncbi:T9SS type A sorting domain-containing protein [Flavobacterium rakeshii]|uniref:T9SS type A sorting domain-containing protein n=1 Tax=Flavobacterium rakeshii TaxID=1038845 RepID=A0A6N8HBZ8_9FLAO|nr:GEVED domain-containing protein [Flavobacterium rakeshii]MUV04179.1 T9SS type A sorting domain-containing protein [Flavobacterium rakeshii]
MKTHLRLFFYVLSFFAMLSYSGKAHAQIDYNDNFEDYLYDWDSYDFDYYSLVPCEGEVSFVTNLYTDFTEAEIVSPSLGVSNGYETTLSFEYKIMDYAGFVDPTVPTANADNWGSIEFYYSTSETGPFTLIHTIDTDNHIESANCATQTVTFTPEEGEEVFVKILAQIGDTSNDFYIIIDSFSVVQDLPACTGAPAIADAVSSTIYACNTADINLSLSPAYSALGLAYQWQYSTDGETFTDVAEGGDMATYSTVQTETTWYRAVVTCTDSDESATSTPVQVVQSDMPCYCDVDFDGGTEPITYVEFAGIENSSSVNTSSPGMESFTGMAPGEVSLGEEYTVVVEGNTNGSYENYLTVFIDFNHNGDFSDEGESFEIGFLDSSTGEDGQQVTGTIAIPADAMTGITFMRVFKSYGVYTSDPCSSEDAVGYGQVEDYLLNITCGTEAPVADAEQNFCSSGVVADLVAEGDTVVWYNAAEDGDMLADTDVLVDGATYYAAQVPDGGCESEMRSAVMVTVTTVSAPTGVAEQSFDTDPETSDYPTLSEIEVTVEEGAVVNWYASEEDALAGENALAGDTVIDVDATYYITQTIGGCESAPFVVGVTLGNESFAFGTFKYYPNPVSNMLNMSYTNVITGVEVYNLVGQRVIEKSYTQNEVQLDMSQLTAGTYMVKVITVDASSTIKVVKQ